LQTFGDLVTFYPHIHALLSDGVFSGSGAFHVLPPIPGTLLVEQLCRAVLDFLIENEAITEDFANKLLAWGHSWFSVDNRVHVGASDLESRCQLARYMSHSFA